MANYTPQEIEQFLQEFFDVVGTRQYVGARYVPIFGRRGEDSIDWDDTAPYEPLTIVLYQGDSYTSRQFVPSGIDIHNTEYWAHTGSYNSQVEQYRQEVLRVMDILPASSFDVTNTVADTIDRAGYLGQYKAIIYSDSTFVESTDVPSVGNTGVLGTMVAEETGMTIDNRGVGGESLNGLIARLEAASPDDFDGFDFVFLAYCTNDWQGSRSMWRYGSLENSFEWYLNRAFDLLDDLAPKSQVIFVTPVYGHRMFTGENDYYAPNTEINYNIMGFTLEDYVDMALKVCHERHVRCIDMYHTMDVDEHNYTDYLVRSSYTPSHWAYDIWVHYSRMCKEKIAKMFLKAFPYMVPASPYEQGTESVVHPTNITMSAAVNTQDPPAFPFDGLPFQSRYGAGIAAYSQPIARVELYGDDTLMLQVSEPMYLQVNTLDSLSSKRYYISRTNGVSCIRVRGLYGTCQIYAVPRATDGTQSGKQGIVYNLKAFQGHVAFNFNSQDGHLERLDAFYVYKLSPDNVHGGIFVQETNSAFNVFVCDCLTTEAVAGNTALFSVPASGFLHNGPQQLAPAYVAQPQTPWEIRPLILSGAINSTLLEVRSFGELAQGTRVNAWFVIPKMYNLMKPSA